jgi:ribosomal protein S26
VEQGKVTEIGCGKGQRNTSKEKAVATEQESMRAQSQKILINYIYEMYMIVKGFLFVGYCCRLGFFVVIC